MAEEVSLTCTAWSCCAALQVTGLSFRPGTHTLYSCSYDRTVKIWSLDDAAYVDSLFGHQVGHSLSFDLT